MELLIVIVIFGLFLSFGAVSVLFEDRANKKGANWGFHIPETKVETIEHPIDLAYSATQTSFENTQVNEMLQAENLNVEVDSFKPVAKEEVDSFEVSAITTETKELLNMLKTEMNEKITNNNDTSKVSTDEQAELKELVGSKVASLITAVIPNLPENEEVVTVGKFINNKITYKGVSIGVANSEIYSDPDDYIVLKGNMLPNGEFRVITWEDAQTIEYGYAGEEFIITKRGA